ncbi:MAG TPA: 50S ribosomal protein L11 methyltransferase [Acidobacteriota bacterium]|nr:50S ribosomal protein L11 methyltransferase [Acidobacteriota bacterium]
MNRGKWLIIKVACSPEHRDRAIELLWECETVGVEEREAGERLFLLAYFGPSCSVQDVVGHLKGELSTTGDSHFEVTTAWVEFDGDEWIKNYQKHFQGVSVDNLFYIYPSWSIPPVQSSIAIQIDPGHAFGTGTHESTRLALRAVHAVGSSASRIIDVGTGSGILAIAAALLNSSAEIVAIDNSSQSIEAARENLRANEQEDRIRLVIGEPDSIAGDFDLVLANLTLEIFRKLAFRLSKLCARDLVLSGFTCEQEAAVLNLFQKNGRFEVAHSWCEQDWGCCHLARIP